MLKVLWMLKGVGTYVTEDLCAYVFQSGGGVWATFPVLLPRMDAWFWLNCYIAALVSFSVLFHLAQASSMKAGPVPRKQWGQVDLVTRGSLEDHTFCERCAQPKDPQAHHCRQCRECVMDMDHHCPFVSALLLGSFQTALQGRRAVITSCLPTSVTIWQ